MQEAERNKQLRHEEKLKFMQEAQAKAEEKERQQSEETRKNAIKQQQQMKKEQEQARRLAMIQGFGQMLTTGASTAMGVMTSSDASGVINALGGGAGQGINALGGLLSNLGMQKTGSIVQTAGALVPIVGQGVAQAIGQVYSRFTEVAGYELPRMLAGSRFNDVFRAKEAPKIGGAYGYSMGESLQFKCVRICIWN